MDCSHEYVHKEGALKERCRLCGAARVHDPDQCNHYYVKKNPEDKKERCTKCGAARVVLEVQDIVTEIDVKKSFFRRIFSKE